MCKIARSKDWATRIIHEMAYQPESVFITLTYDDRHLPKDLSIRKSELQKFLKRFRKKYPKRIIRYYGCGEYGEIYGRPHYHLIMFNVRTEDFTPIDKIHNNKSGNWETVYTHSAWKNGIIHIGNVTYNSARYVADYVNKTYYGEKKKEIYGEKEQPFQLMSKGLGKQWALDNKEYLFQKLGCTINGREVGLNKYYRNILEIPGEFVFEESKRRNPEDTEEDKKLNAINSMLKINGIPEHLWDTLEPIYKMRELNFKKSLQARRKKDYDL